MERLTARSSKNNLAYLVKVKAENDSLQHQIELRCEAALSNLKGDCASCVKNGVDWNVCYRCIGSQTYDEYEWRGEEGEVDAND